MCSFRVVQRCAEFQLILARAGACALVDQARRMRSGEPSGGPERLPWWLAPWLGNTTIEANLQELFDDYDAYEEALHEPASPGSEMDAGDRFLAPDVDRRDEDCAA